MRQIAIDIETFSPAPLAKTGVYPCAEHPEFEMLLFGYSIDGGDVHVIDLARGDRLPDQMLAALVDPGVVKWAHSAAFERVALSAWLQRHHRELLAAGFLDPSQWRCTMVWSAYLGLPMSLDAVGAALNLDVQKDTAGKLLIKQSCTPATPSVLNGGGTRNLHSSDPTGSHRFRFPKPSGTPTPWINASTTPASCSTTPSQTLPSPWTTSIVSPRWRGRGS